MMASRVGTVDIYVSWSWRTIVRITADLRRIEFWQFPSTQSSKPFHDDRFAK